MANAESVKKTIDTVKKSREIANGYVFPEVNMEMLAHIVLPLAIAG